MMGKTRERLLGTLVALPLALMAAAPLAMAQSALPKADMEAVEASPLEGLSREELHLEIRAYLLENPEVLVEAMQVLEQRRMAEQEAASEQMVSTYADEIFEDGFSYVGGNPEGSVTVVEFQDYRCGYCKRAHADVQELVSSDGDIRLIVKELPILGADSTLASRFAIATDISQGPEAYKRISDALMEYSGPINDLALEKLAGAADVSFGETMGAMEDAQIEARIQQTMELAQKLQVNGTPTFVIGDEIVRGYIPLGEMREVVDQFRKDAL